MHRFPSDPSSAEYPPVAADRNGHRLHPHWAGRMRAACDPFRSQEWQQFVQWDAVTRDAARLRWLVAELPHYVAQLGARDGFAAIRRTLGAAPDARRVAALRTPGPGREARVVQLQPGEDLGAHCHHGLGIVHIVHGDAVVATATALADTTASDRTYAFGAGTGHRIRAVTPTVAILIVATQPAADGCWEHLSPLMSDQRPVAARRRVQLLAAHSH